MLTGACDATSVRINAVCEKAGSVNNSFSRRVVSWNSLRCPPAPPQQQPPARVPRSVGEINPRKGRGPQAQAWERSKSAATRLDPGSGKRLASCWDCRVGMRRGSRSRRRGRLRPARLQQQSWGQHDVRRPKSASSTRQGYGYGIPMVPSHDRISPLGPFWVRAEHRASRPRVQSLTRERIQRTYHNRDRVSLT